MSRLSELIQSARDEVVPRKTVDVEVLVAGELVKFRFEKLDPMEWRGLIAKFPAREAVQFDRNLGYNFDAAPAGYPVEHVFELVDDEPVAVSAEDWAGVFALLESPDLKTISLALWGVHEFEPQQAMLAAKKAARASQTK